MVRETVARTFSSLSNRNYRWYFSGQSVSMIGTWMQSVAQSWLVYSLTHSGFQTGLIIALQTLPILVFGPFGGTLGDRFGRYRTLFWTQGLAGAQALALAVLDLTGQLRLWELYLIAVSLGFIKLVDTPTRQSFIIEMVGREHLRNAVTLNTISNNAARVIGPSVAGLLIASVGSGFCFLINASSFLFVIAGLIAIDQSSLRPARRSTRIRGQVSEGFRYVLREPVVRNALLMMTIVGCLTYEFQTTLPLMAGEVFHGDAATYGFLTGFMGVGAVLGGLVAAGRRTSGLRSLYLTAIGFGAVVLLAALAPSRMTEELVLVLVGAASVSFSSLTNSTLQLESDPQMRGRVMSLWAMAFQGTTPIGSPLVGFIAGALGARYGLGIGAVAALGAGGLGLLSLYRHRRARPRDAVREILSRTRIPNTDREPTLSE
jgi:MFS family permease